MFWKDDSAWSVWTGLEVPVDRVGGGYGQDWSSEHTGPVEAVHRAGVTAWC